MPIGTVASLTAWDLVRTTGGGTVEIVLAAEIAGESVVENLQNSKVGKKYSFSLRHTDGSSRVADLKLTVVKPMEDGTEPIIMEQLVGSTLVENCPGCAFGDSSAVDFSMNRMPEKMATLRF